MCALKPVNASSAKTFVPPPPPSAVKPPVQSVRDAFHLNAVGAPAERSALAAPSTSRLFAQARHATAPSREGSPHADNCACVDGLSAFLAAGERENKEYALQEYQRIATNARCDDRLKAAQLLALFGDGRQRHIGLGVLRKIAATKGTREYDDTNNQRVIAATFLFLEGDRTFRMDDELRLQVAENLCTSSNQAQVKRGLRVLVALAVTPRTKDEVRLSAARHLATGSASDKVSEKIAWKVFDHLAIRGKSDETRLEASLILARSGDRAVSDRGRKALLHLAETARETETRKVSRDCLEELDAEKRRGTPSSRPASLPASAPMPH